jgi:ABC-2 type transport system permease protein
VNGAEWRVVATLAARDWRAVRRSKSVMIPMLAVPIILLIVMPFGIGLAAQARTGADLTNLLSRVPGDMARPIRELPQREQLIVLVNGYLLAPLFLIVPLMVSAVLAADAFAGEKERRTLESLLHLPVPDRALFLGKVVSAMGPAVAISWIGFICFCIVSNAVAWPVLHRIFVPTSLWLVMILWVAPAVALLGLGILVRISAKVRTTQEANQLGGAVVLPLVFIAVGQSTGLLLVPWPVAIVVGGVLWAVALLLLRRGAQRFTRDRLAGDL